MSTALFMFFVATFIGITVLASIMDSHTGLATTTLTTSVAEPANDEQGLGESDADYEERLNPTLLVHRTQGFPSSGVLIIDGETICYSGVTGTSFTGLTRGCRDTSAAEHSTVARVYAQAPGLINAIIGFSIAEAFSDGSAFGIVKGVIKTVAAGPQFLAAVSKMVMWNYDFLEGPYVYVKYFVLYPLSAGMVMSFMRMAMGR